MFDLNKYKTENVYLSSITDENGNYLGIDPFISVPNIDCLINKSKARRTYINLRRVNYHHAGPKNQIVDYFEQLPQSLSKGDIFTLTDKVNREGLKPKVKQKSLYN